MIAEPFEGTPAAKAGLKAGDILMEIDGKDLAGKNNSEVSQMLRGQAGTSFKLKVERPNEKGGQTPMEFTIVRESIQTPAIPYATVMDNKVGYISLSTFSGNPSKDFKKALLDLKKQGATSLVIDLRNNGGGLLDEAVEIANYFLPRGKGPARYDRVGEKAITSCRPCLPCRLRAWRERDSPRACRQSHTRW